MTDESKKPESTAPKSAESAAEPEMRHAKDELFEAIDHFKKAATILFERAQREPAVRTGVKDVERVVGKVTDAADPVLDKVQEAAQPMVDKVTETAEPLVKHFVSELGKFTKSLLETAEKRGKPEADDKKK